MGGRFIYIPEPQSEERGQQAGKLHKVEEVAELWGVSPRTIRREIQAGRLGCVKVGRCVRVSDAQIAAYVEGGYREGQE
ncbi:MAG: helix-turn-helix domain-containing protein [Coriobacteriia bacterium]|nr:helix-turn-helix domain-containing protein [Coriobacteriia bacterium]